MWSLANVFHLVRHKKIKKSFRTEKNESLKTVVKKPFEYKYVGISKCCSEICNRNSYSDINKQHQKQG